MLQLAQLTDVLLRQDITRLDHGVCIGADEQANDVAQRLGIETGGHPPLNQSKLADCECDIWFEPEEYLDRNHTIVDMCKLLIVAPLTNQEVLRSGTWATWRYACAQGREIVMLER